MTQFKYERIVVLLARTEHDRPLVRYARMLAEQGIGRLFQFVHVRTPAQTADDPASDADVLVECETLVTEAFGNSPTTARTSCHVLNGVRVDRLIEFATRSRSDLILLGHRNMRSGQRSLARRLAMISPCSVWMVPEGSPVTISRILAPIDFSGNSGDSLEMAVDVARAAGLKECLAVHAFFDDSVIRYDERADEVRRNAQQAFSNFMAPIDTGSIHVEPIFVEGNNIPQTLLRTAEKCQADLLVMNTRGRSQAAAILLGSVTTQVMIETKIPILVVKHFGAMMHLFDALRESRFWDRPNQKMN